MRETGIPNHSPPTKSAATSIAITLMTSFAMIAVTRPTTEHIATARNARPISARRFDAFRRASLSPLRNRIR